MKFSMYCVPVRTKKGITLFNTRTSEYVDITDKEEIEFFEKMQNEKFFPEDNEIVIALKKRFYIVDDDFDEYKSAKELVENSIQALADHLSLFIYTTEKCNFRCVYCPQKHAPKVLSESKWNALYMYIEKSLEKGLYKCLEISLFGGEPLLESKAILKFMKKIKNLLKKYKDVDVRYIFTTNGYLLTPELYDKFSKYNTKFYQITVDGFAETHDKARVRADGSGTWDVIMENLKYINTKDDDVKISIRTNYNNDNYKSLKNFYSWINTTLDNKKFTFDVYPVGKYSDEVDDKYLAKKSKEEVDKLIQKYDRYSRKTKENLCILGKICYCAHKNFFAITADGKISKCQQAHDNCDTVGYLTDDGDFVFNDNIKQWTEDYEVEECKTCPLYPICAARTCPKKKVNNADSRPDCIARQMDVKEYIAMQVRNNYLLH